MIRLLIWCITLLALSACGGGSGGGGGDTTAPNGYSIADLSSTINSQNQDSVGFDIAGAEIGSTYSYRFTDEDGDQVQATGTVTAITQSIDSIDLSSLDDGTIEIQVDLVDSAGNQGVSVNASFQKLDTAPPSGYSISNLTNPVTSANQTNVGFGLSGAEIGTIYRYTFTDKFGAQLSETAPVTQEEQNFFDIDLSTLADGDIDLQLALTDSSNNVGEPQELTTAKDAIIGVTAIELSGRITFDRVPHNGAGIGLDYSSITTNPAREVSLRVVDVSGAIIVSTKTDQNGEYQVEVPVDTLVRVEVLAELFEADPSLYWLVRVNENSSSTSLYVLQGALVDSGELDQVRDLHADSGWGGSSYSDERAAAPFAILDSIYKIFQRLRLEGVSLALPELDIRWDTSNSNGSFYASGSSDYIELAGLENVDTDEYDEHVIVHEWRHYYEDQVSRGDTIGGAHSITSQLEPRTAYSEGVGNAWSAIILDDPIYKDALGNDQQSGFQIDIESSGFAEAGWYIEKSIQEIIYDLVDTTNEGVDDLSLSVSDLIQTWQSSYYVEQTSLTTIYSFREALELIVPGSVTEIDDLYTGQDIFGSGLYGAGETNNSGLTYSLPVYHELSPNGIPIEICSDNSADGEYNRLENRQLVRFTVGASGSHTIALSRVVPDPLVEVDPDFYVYKRGVVVASGISAPAETESWTGDLATGEHIIDAYDYFNADDSALTGGLVCYDLSVLKN